MSEKLPNMLENTIQKIRELVDINSVIGEGVKVLEGAVVSSRREGDTMIPFGKHTPVKLKKLMIDAHVERAMRRSVPLVRDGEGNVLFAVGLRCAEQCRAQDDEKQMMVRFCGVWPGADNE